MLSQGVNIFGGEEFAYLFANITRNFTTLNAGLGMHYTIPTLTLTGDFKLTFNAVASGNNIRILGASANFNNNIELTTTSLAVDASGNISSLAGSFDMKIGEYTSWIIERIGTNVTYTQDGILLGTSTGSTGTLIVNTINNVNGFYSSMVVANVKIIDSSNRNYPITETWIGPSTVLNDTSGNNQDGTAVNVDSDDSEPFTFDGSVSPNTWTNEGATRIFEVAGT